jgi:hypothetical protein
MEVKALREVPALRPAREADSDAALVAAAREEPRRFLDDAGGTSARILHTVGSSRWAKLPLCTTASRTS